MVIVFVFSVWIRRLRPIFPLSQVELCLAVRERWLTATNFDRRSHCLGTMPIFTFAKHVSFEHSTGIPCPVISSRRDGNINKRTKLKSFLTLDRRSVSPHRPACVRALRGQWAIWLAPRLSLGTESTGTVLIPSQMSEIAGHDLATLSLFVPLPFLPCRIPWAQWAEFCKWNFTQVCNYSFVSPLPTTRFSHTDLHPQAALHTSLLAGDGTQCQLYLWSDLILAEHTTVMEANQRK